MNWTGSGLAFISAHATRPQNCDMVSQKAAGAKDGMDVEPCVIGTDTDLGAQYLEAMQLAGDYAYAGRDWVCSKIATLLGATSLRKFTTTTISHGVETHNGEDLWVVRKGATPACPRAEGFRRRNDGRTSVILEGVENDDAKYSLYSTVHGAGRIMGRMEARGKTDRKTGHILRPGKVTSEMMQGWLKRANVELRGAGLDESPDCYKRLSEVLCGAR